jgi:Bacterial Ig-like domain (group 1)
VSERPSVIVRDQAGQPVAGARVTFSVETGGGTVTGGNATTDASGIATVGSWTLGPSSGSNTLVARTGNLPTVTFTASGADPCATAATHVLGTTTQGALSTQDCRLSDGTFVDFYSVNLPTAGTYIFSQTASTFDTYIAMLTTGGGLIGVNDDVGNDTTKSSLKVIVPAGTFIVAANSFNANATGNYTLASAATTAQVSFCEDVFVVRGVTTAQSLQTSDCTLNGVFGDEYVIVLNAGQPLTVSMSSTDIDSYLEIHSGSSNAILASNDDADGTTKNATVTFTPPTTDFYVITSRTQAAGQTGAYTLTIQ